MKQCYCTDPNCGCSLSDKLTVGNINSCNIPMPSFIPNTFYIENKPLTIKQLCLYTVEELLAELSKRTNVFVNELHKDDNTIIHTITIKK